MIEDPKSPKPYEKVFADYATDMPERPTSETYRSTNPTFREAFPESMHTWEGPSGDNGVKEPLPPIDVEIVDRDGGQNV